MHLTGTGLKLVTALVACFFLAVGAGCKKSSSDAFIPPNTGLRPESKLKHNLCNWPEDEFSPTNKVSVTAALAVGEYAIDFTLKDTSGTDHKLSTLLQTRPVFMIFGSYT